jgi:hypothetical protein
MISFFLNVGLDAFGHLVLELFGGRGPQIFFVIR